MNGCRIKLKRVKPTEEWSKGVWMNVLCKRFILRGLAECKYRSCACGCKMTHQNPKNALADQCH